MLRDDVGEVYEAVLTFFRGDVAKTDQWFAAPNPSLGHLSPNDLVELDRTEALRAFVRQSLAENKP